MNDKELVGAIRNGNAEAEALLYTRFAPRVYYLALRIVRVQADAEDVRAETILRVLQALRQGKLREAAALAAFVLETAHNVIRERARREARLSPIDAELPGAAALQIEAPFADPIARRALAQTISAMRPRERAFLRMYYYEERPNAEISRRLGIAEERLRLVKSRTLRRFRERFEQLGVR